MLCVCQEPEEDEVTTTPDSSLIGLQVTRKTRCALNDADETLYILEAAGIASNLQWLIGARSNSIFFVTAAVKARPFGIAFQVLSYWDIAHLDQALFVTHMQKAAGATPNISVTLSPARDTPCKRQEKLRDHTVTVPPDTQEDFSKRRRL